MSFNRLILKSACIVGFAGLSTACASILPEPAPPSTIYRLSVPMDLSQAADPAFNAKTVKIVYPRASKALAGSDIIVSPDGRRLSSAAASAWAEPVPSLFRDMIVEVFATDELIVGVIGSESALYRLETDISRFEAVFENGEDAAPMIYVQMSMTLSDTKTRTVIRSSTMASNKRASTNSVSAIVDAKEQAARDVVGRLTAWVNDNLANRRS